MSKNWADMGTYGRYIRRGLTLLMSEIEREETKKKSNKEDYKIDDLERIVSIVNTLTRAGVAQAKLADIADHDKRLKDIEAIINKLPPGILQEVKSNIGN